MGTGHWALGSGHTVGADGKRGRLDAGGDTCPRSDVRRHVREARTAAHNKESPFVTGVDLAGRKNGVNGSYKHVYKQKFSNSDLNIR
ncbi:hypothetical protein ACMD2_11601 [Ananas comosus]|uniref:Uncharacterized protein n=1 Tax=Ananas comosus TaxID=4615 RepID=A0A199W9D2_ANACO|nr:hypothetical protein ACMD2_11601 [Ananas comosus]